MAQTQTDTPKLLGTFNNCGLHALVPSIKKAIDLGEGPRMLVDQKNQVRKMEILANYERLRSCFAQFYNIDNAQLNWSKFNELLQKFNPYESQLVLGPVLREFMKKTLEDRYKAERIDELKANLQANQLNLPFEVDKVDEEKEEEVNVDEETKKDNLIKILIDHQTELKTNGRFSSLTPSQVYELAGSQLGIEVDKLGGDIYHLFEIKLHSTLDQTHWELTSDPEDKPILNETFQNICVDAGNGTTKISQEALNTLKKYVATQFHGPQKEMPSSAAPSSASTPFSSPIVYDKELNAYFSAVNENCFSEHLEKSFVTPQVLEEKLKELKTPPEKESEEDKLKRFANIQLLTRYKELLQDRQLSDGVDSKKHKMLVFTKDLKSISYCLAGDIEKDEQHNSGASAGSQPGRENPYPMTIPQKATLKLKYNSDVEILIHPQAKKVTFGFETMLSDTSVDAKKKRVKKNDAKIDACVNQALLMFDKADKGTRTLELDFSNLHGVLRDDCKEQIITKIIHKYEAAGKDAGDKQRRYKEIVNALLKGGSMSDHEYIRYGIKPNSSERDLDHKEVKFSDYKVTMDDIRKKEAIKHFVKYPRDKGEESKWYQTNTDYKYWKWSEPKWEKRVQNCFYRLSTEPKRSEKVKIEKELQEKYGFKEDEIRDTINKAQAPSISSKQSRQP